VLNDVARTKPHIAVLEDHDDTRELLSITLGDDFSVQEFRNAPDLLAALEREEFSAVVADIMLPGVDGFSLIEAVRSDDRFKDLCVVAVTALAKQTDRDKAMKAGFTDYLTKPIAPAEIASVLRKHIKRRVVTKDH
jgi:CheY-like chemotaxis protein